MRVPRARDLHGGYAEIHDDADLQIHRTKMGQYEPGDGGRGPLGRLIDVIANAAIAGWGQTFRTALLIIVGAVAVALVLVAMGTGHF